MSNRSAAHVVLLQQRILSVITATLLVAFLFWIIAISTDYWTVVDGKNGIYVATTKRYFLQSRNGIWKTCRTVFGNKTKTKPATIADRCSYTDFFPESHQVTTYIHYQRTIAAFSLITIFIMGLGFVFSLYTFKHTRYMYKRLAACCHLLSSGCALVVLEVSATAVSYAATYRHPPGSVWYYGFSYILAWITFVIEVVATLTFAICSRKRKKDKAPNEEFAIEEEPTIIGR